MGSDSAKTHEAFTVTPAAATLGLAAPELAGSATAQAQADAAITEAFASPLLAVPDTAAEGDPAGAPLLVGGADLEDSSATLLTYTGSGGPRDVLFATVTPEAEQKLLEALALNDEHKVAVTVDKQVNGRLPIDEQHQLFEQVQTIVKSVNHHLKAGDGIPEHTHANHTTLVAALDELDADPQRTAAEHAMIGHYRAAADQLAERLAPGYAVAYDNGGKVPSLTAHEVASTIQVTELVPAPAGDLPDGLAAAHARQATRIKPTLQGGHAIWDGKQRSTGAGHEYVIDLGDGYTAVYRPHAAAEGKKNPAFSQRGGLEIIAPPGGGHGAELVTRLGQLNLVNRPMSQAEGEWAYLSRNITAQRLDTRPEVQAALEGCKGLEDATYQELWTARADEAIGMNEHQLADFGRHLLLEAEARALTHKVAVLRDAVAHATGHPDGAALAASPGYDPTPTRAGGWLQWNRFDVAANPAGVDGAFGSRGLSHHVRGGDLLGLLTNGGVLACTERRRLMGIKTNVGASEAADMDTGGAQSVFLRAAKRSSSGPVLCWDDPSRLLMRADWYAYDGDHYGAINPKSHQYSATKLTRDPHAVAKFHSASNEVMFRNGIDLLGEQAPSRILCGSKSMRTKVLDALTSRGISHLAGRPIQEVVKP
ncbi:MAG: hypothetical protein WD250_15150 [Egibacteraceae bacterium]